MSALDRVIASLLRNVDDVQRSMAQSEVVKSSVEETQNTFESVGMEGRAAEAAAMADWVEEIQSQLPQIESQIQSQIPFAESLKTAGGGAAPGGNTTGSDASPEPVATTGADPKPNPVHATPAHTREPSRKVGDPVKPPHQISQGKDQKMSRFRRGSRSVARNADDVQDAIQETDSILTGLESMDVPPDKTYGVTTTSSQPQMVQPTGHQVDTGDALTSATMLAVVTIDILGRIRRKKKGKL